MFRKTLQFESVAINLPPTRTVNDWRQNVYLKNMADEAIPREFVRRTTCLQPQTVWSRKVIENTCWILASRWRISNSPLNASFENIETYVKSAIVLHNYLRQNNALYCPQIVVDCEEMDGSITKRHWRELVNNNSPFLTPLNNGLWLKIQRGCSSHARCTKRVCKFFRG